MSRGLASVWVVMSAPLLGHGPRQTGQGARAFLPALGTRRSPVHTWMPPFNQVCRSQQRQVLEPQHHLLCLAVSEPPRLHDLVCRPDLGPDATERILQCDLPYRCRQQRTYELERLELLLLTSRPPACSRLAQVRTWWMGHHQVPAVAQDLEHVTLDVKQPP